MIGPYSWPVIPVLAAATADNVAIALSGPSIAQERMLPVHLSLTRSNPLIPKEVISPLSSSAPKGPNRWSAPDRFPAREEPVLPETRHIQVMREWCPETVFTLSEPG